MKIQVKNADSNPKKRLIVSKDNYDGLKYNLPVRKRNLDKACVWNKRRVHFPHEL